MSEHSPGVGREERPPIVVVVHSLTQVLLIISLCLLGMNGCMLWLFYLSEEPVSKSKVSILECQ